MISSCKKPRKTFIGANPSKLQSNWTTVHFEYLSKIVQQIFIRKAMEEKNRE